ncbi:WXG100 family type VII secretion target [Amycolatopsis sp. cg5]|uniref:WXG100 family type VII secretion target n=1 Tax=Amycolatopsis sp. cg5 TaxID=3238802 RepID=UPI0035237E30
MSNDTIKYDYPVIEQCLGMMSKKATEIENQADELEKSVKSIMTGWEGSTADSYERLAGDLKADLIANKTNLENLKAALERAAQEMQDKDRSGAGRLG